MSDFEDIPDQIKELIERRVNWSTPLRKLADKYKISLNEVVAHLREHDDYVAHMAKEKLLSQRKKYGAMSKLAFSTIEDIMNTDHVVSVFGKDDLGKDVLIGSKTDSQMAKVKLQAAEKILENVGAKDKDQKAGIQIDNRQVHTASTPEKSTKEIVLEQKANEVQGLLEQCVIDVDIVENK